MRLLLFNKKIWHVFALIAIFQTAALMAVSQTVTTDKPDYSPGEIVTISGTGFWANEEIELLIEHMFDHHGDEYLYVTADENGNFETSEYVIADDELYELFWLTATGLSSGLKAYAEFTDGPKLGPITPITQTNVVYAGAGGIANFTYTVTRGSNDDGNVTADISITGLPAGVTVQSGLPNNNVSVPSTGYPGVFALTVANTVAEGSYPFTMEADGPGADNETGTGTLVVSPCLAPSAPTDPVNQIICSDETIPALSVTVPAGITVDWFADATGGPALATGTTSYTPASAGTYYAQARNTTTGCVSSTRTAVTLTISPVATVNAGPDQDICSDETVQLAGSFGGGASSVTWTTSGDGTFDDASETDAVYTLGSADIAAGTVTLTLTTDDPSGPCVEESDDITITIYPAATVNAGPDQEICSNETVQLAGSRGGGASSVTWTSSGDGSFDDDSKTDAVYTPGTADIAAGTVTLTLTTNNPAGPCGAESDEVEITINGVPVITPSDATPTVQYSDPFSPALTVTATDDGAGSDLDASTQWKKSTDVSWTTGMPDDLTFDLTDTDANSKTWTIKGTADLAPGDYIIRVTVTDGDCEDYADITVTVEAEDACAVYAGVYYASTGSVNSTTATVMLAATIIDDNDGNSGDITNAMVQFYKDGSLIATVPVQLPVGEIGDGSTIGTASYEWTGVPVGTYTITVKIVGYYTNSTDDDCDGEALVTVGIPSPEFITGGGYVIMENSKGLKAGTTGLKNNFGFNVKFNKRMTNLQGNINSIIRRIEGSDIKIYQIKGNVLNSLAIEGNKATFTGKANIQDITDPDNVISVEGNCNLQFTMTDNGEPGSSDLISITVWKSDGGMWFTTNWANNKPAEQVLDGGNLVVHSASSSTSDPGSTTGSPKKKSAIIGEELVTSSFTTYPNPFSNKVFFDIVRTTDADVRLDIFDMRGAHLSTLVDSRIEAGVTYRYEYVPMNVVQGMLMYRLVVDNEVSTGKILYQK